MSRCKEKAFVTEKFGMKESNILDDVPLAEKNYANWRIPDKKQLLLHRDDWRKAIPAYEEYRLIQDRLPLGVPDSHCVYDPANYPPNDKTKLLPFGAFYGLP